MSCGCIPGSKYERISNTDSVPDLPLALEERLCHVNDVKQVELKFYNDDGTCTTVVVEENLRACDLCQLLALKNHVAKDVNWTVVEHIEELGLECSLEDHEEVLATYLDWGGSNSAVGHKFFFRKDFRKYEFFHNPQQFFPVDMTDLGVKQECLAESSELARAISLQTILNDMEDLPKTFGHLWIREPKKQAWKKAFFYLTDKTLYYSLKSSEKDPSLLTKYIDLNECKIFTVVDHRNYKAPTEHCFCLKPCRQSRINYRDLRILCCDSESVRMCWVAALRLAKYGKQLHDNFRSFRSRQMEVMSSSPKEYSSHQVPTESMRTRVAMDFTGNYGKIVDDPKEAKAIAVAEGYNWIKKIRQSNRASGVRVFQYGIHITQPWFHSGLSREESVELLNKHGTVDGVFLVRESQSTVGVFVLTFVVSGKVYHTQIAPIDEKETIVYSLDNGKTKFYDLLQLVEFHQLNCGPLPTKLCHYIVQCKGISGKKEPSLSPRQRSIHEC